MFAEALLSNRNASFDGARNEEGVGVFRTGYPAHRSGRTRVRPGREYLFRVRGRIAEDAIFHALVMFTGKVDGKPARTQKSCFYNKLAETTKSLEITVKAPPEFDEGSAHAQLFFYRHNKKGTLLLESYEFRRADVPETGLDVTDRLEGVLPALERPFTTWVYSDRAGPLSSGAPKIDIRFFNPEDTVRNTTKERAGVGDF
mgnify:CR=1 FL=1